MTSFSLLTNLVVFIGLGLVLGSVAAGWWIVPAARADLRREAARHGLRGALVLVVAMLLVFGRQLVEFRDPFSPWLDEASLLWATAWGRSWLWAVAGSLLLVMAGRARVAGRRGSEVAGALLAGAMGVFPGLTGHANAGELRGLTLAADALHVWAMGAWVGGLAIVLLLETAHRRSGTAQGSLLPELIPRFTPLAMASVAVLSLTGLLATWVHLDGPAALPGTPYGRLLLAKLILVAGVLALGWVNFRRLAPRLDTPEGPAALRRSARWELMIALLVLCVTAVLVRTSP